MHLQNNGDVIKAREEGSTQYELACNELQSSICDLTGLLDNLAVRIAPALTPNTTGSDHLPDDEKEKLKIPRSSIESYLKVESDAVKKCNQKIRDMIDHCCM